MDLEIREKLETINGVEVLNKYIVHPVIPNMDTLFKLSYKYKVSKREISIVNGLAGEDIFYCKELLIPFRDQIVIDTTKEKTDEQKQKEERERRAACLSMLNHAIMDHEIKAERKGEIERQKKPQSNFKSEAKFYLEDNEWDYWKALAAYKEDL